MIHYPTRPKLVFCFLDNVDAANHVAYEQWWREAVGNVSRCAEGFCRALAFRADPRPPGGIFNSVLAPTFLTMVELSRAGGLLDGSISKMLSPPERLVPERALHGAYFEPNPTQRQGPFLDESHPASIFLIVQDVQPADESAYNYWYDIDDGIERAAPKMGHYTERQRFDGFLRATRLKAVPFSMDRTEIPIVTKANHIEVFEIRSTAVMQGEQYTAAAHEPPKVSSTKPPFKLWVRQAFEEVWSITEHC
ncbi:hypothetical protein [Devosia ginsengisoli]|uniref:hypothetical protein n=1 Tax=Devosia ginsengisoli TaxID=400770 RepID=UPI0026EB3142|nr:hypothetical protein [Devosia ginsengisoli]MCR6671287.1 hypothetical protein [Devosia ginsengisoli]